MHISSIHAWISEARQYCADTAIVVYIHGADFSRKIPPAGLFLQDRSNPWFLRLNARSQSYIGPIESFVLHTLKVYGVVSGQTHRFRPRMYNRIRISTTTDDGMTGFLRIEEL